MIKIGLQPCSRNILVEKYCTEMSVPYHVLAQVPVYLDYLSGTLEWFERADTLNYKARHKVVNIDIQGSCLIILLEAFGRDWF